jgi:hypothetical protein
MTKRAVGAGLIALGLVAALTMTLRQQAVLTRFDREVGKLIDDVIAVAKAGAAKPAQATGLFEQAPARKQQLAAVPKTESAYREKMRKELTSLFDQMTQFYKEQKGQALSERTCSAVAEALEKHRKTLREGPVEEH